jgi:epoxyqueuosine reductase QueG
MIGDLAAKCKKGYNLKVKGADVKKTEGLKEFLRKCGADLVGVADLAPFKREYPTLPEGLLEPYLRAVSVGVALDRKVIEGITDLPTPEYAGHYREINALLDSIALQATGWIKEMGFDAAAIPASNMLDEERLVGSISHKAVARMAGLGWQGKSLLIVNPVYGPGIRLVTVLTDMPLQPNCPPDNGCGECSECADACPVGAIKNVSTDSRYESREEAVDIKSCNQRTLENMAAPEIGEQVCGVCIKACLYGREDK